MYLYYGEIIMTIQLSRPGLLTALLFVSVPAIGQTALDQIRSQGVIRIGIANEAPYAYLDEQGEARGEAPVVLREVLQQLDPAITVEAVVTEFGNLIPDLKAGKFDMIAAGMFITPTRCAEVAFTEPTYKVGEAFAVRQGNPKQLTGYEAIAAQPEVRVAVMAGAVEYSYAYAANVYYDQVLVVPDYQQALDKLQAGDVDAIGMTSLTAQALVEDSGDDKIEATEQFYPQIDGEPIAGYGAFAVRPDDQALLDELNRHLKTLIGTDQHWQAVKPYGFGPAMLPDKTAAQLCAR